MADKGFSVSDTKTTDALNVCIQALEHADFLECLTPGGSTQGMAKRASTQAREVLKELGFLAEDDLQKALGSQKVNFSYTPS